MIRIIGYPNSHFFTTFEDGSFDQERFKFYRAELSILGFDRFFSHVPDVHSKHLVVEEHTEWNFIIHLEPVEIDVPCVIDSAEYILYTIRHFRNTISTYRRIGYLVEGYVFIF